MSFAKCLSDCLWVSPLRCWFHCSWMFCNSTDPLGRLKMFQQPVTLDIAPGDKSKPEEQQVLGVQMREVHLKGLRFEV